MFVLGLGSAGIAFNDIRWNTLGRSTHLSHNVEPLISGKCACNTIGKNTEIICLAPYNELTVFSLHEKMVGHTRKEARCTNVHLLFVFFDLSVLPLSKHYWMTASTFPCSFFTSSSVSVLSGLRYVQRTVTLYCSFCSGLPA